MFRHSQRVSSRTRWSKVFEASPSRFSFTSTNLPLGSTLQNLSKINMSANVQLPRAIGKKYSLSQCEEKQGPTNMFLQRGNPSSWILQLNRRAQPPTALVTRPTLIRHPSQVLKTSTLPKSPPTFAGTLLP